jgi:hypothetical protein
MVDAETTATDTDSTPPSTADTNVDQAIAQSGVKVYDTTPEGQGTKRSSDMMTSSQFFEAERKKNGSKSPARKAPDAAEAELRNAKLREMELIEKNRVEIVPAQKATNWTPILWALGFIVVIAVLWSWLS